MSCYDVTSVSEKFVAMTSDWLSRYFVMQYIVIVNIQIMMTSRLMLLLYSPNNKLTKLKLYFFLIGSSKDSENLMSDITFVHDDQAHGKGYLAQFKCHLRVIKENKIKDLQKSRIRYNENRNWDDQLVEEMTSFQYLELIYSRG